MTAAKGKVIGGKYRLESLLGAGGMGEVWRATHLELDAPVAVKLIHAGNHSQRKVVERFLREAKAAAAVRHRNIVAITDFGTDGDGQPFMVMELLEGKSLAARMESGEPLPFAMVIDVVALCLSGLAAVHDAGLVHRDLKPENIFLIEDADGTYPKLLDFGVSRSVPGSGRERKGAMSTSGGAFVGTPQFMSPEQARGLPDIDRRSDLYAVGVILYEALTGKLPYDSPHVGDMIIAIVAGGAPTLFELRPDLGQAISDIVSKAMSRDRADRFDNAREMRTALLHTARQAVPGFSPRLGSGDITGQFMLERRVRQSVPTLDSPDSRPSTRPAETEPPRRRARAWAIIAGGCALLALGGGAVIWATMSRALVPPGRPHADGVAVSTPIARATPTPTREETSAAVPPSIVIDAGSSVEVEPPHSAPLTNPSHEHHHHHDDQPAPPEPPTATPPPPPPPPPSDGVFRDPGF